MTASLQVQRHGHINVFSDDYDGVLDRFRTTFGARVFREWEEKDFGGKNALWLAGGTCFEIFAPTSPDRAIGQWLGKQGPGWHSLEWTVPSLEEATEIVTERGIRVTDTSPGNYIFTHPRDLHGLCLELTTHHFDDDDRDAAGWSIPAPGEANPLGLNGPAVLKIASANPEQAAADVAEFVGRDTYKSESIPLNTVSHGISFGDHAVEFVGSRTGSEQDLVGAFLKRRGERIYTVTLPIASQSDARAFLAGQGVHFTQWGKESLVLNETVMFGASIELTVR